MQASSILNRAVAIGLATSQPPPFPDATPITIANLLHAVDCWDKEILTSSLCYFQVLEINPFHFSFSLIHFLDLQCVY
jgi:hypothetical protein